MNKPLKVLENFYWVGALDPDLKIFDIVMETKYGTTYNSYILKGSEKTVLFETVKNKFTDQCIERIKEVVDPKNIDYIIVNHTEPDHAGSVAAFLDYCPNATVVGTGPALRFLKEITNRDFKSLPVSDGDTLNLGDKTIKFIMAPFLHWPDTMYSYIEEDKILVTCDSFGAHYCDEKIFNDAMEKEKEEEILDAYKYYFDMIMSPFKPYVIQALNKIKDLDINIICPGHGLILRKEIQKYIDLYKKWATVEENNNKTSVVIAYVSAYGYTKTLAEEIAKGIKDAGILDVSLFDMVYEDHNKVMEEINKAKGILFGSPTIVGDTLAPIWKLLTSLNPIIHKGKIAGAFGSYGWSGEAVSNIEGRLKQLRFKIPVPGLKILFNPSKEQLKLAYEFGKKFGSAVLEK
ncbi:FprA family A-type flavoprotein [Defluviitalea phaphyphila]|uniref:FprA family A-type flavoprotein n=1 Tax=Defluviitalea phaphyphila TaxID=1473580 RepID=UPI000730A8AA|nr:FprA family A-type flavoprotein [Defluviitalea phaphyphila]